MKVLTLGTFDLFHAGHINFLQHCAAFGPVIVAVNPDDFVEQFKGRRPICTLNERIAAVAGCRHVSDVIVNEGGQYAAPVIERVRPNLLAIDTGWLPAGPYLDQLSISRGFLEREDIALVFIPRTPGISTTDILGRCRQPPERAGAGVDARQPPVPDRAADGNTRVRIGTEAKPDREAPRTLPPLPVLPAA